MTKVMAGITTSVDGYITGPNLLIGANGPVISGASRMIRGMGGGDTIYTGPGNNTVVGGPGNNTYTAGSGFNTGKAITVQFDGSNVATFELMGGNLG